MRQEQARRGIKQTEVERAKALAANEPIEAKVRRVFQEKKGDLFSRRVGACLVDLVLSYAILILAEAGLGDKWYDRTFPVWLCLFAAYYVATEAKFGATPGKKLTGLRVVTKTLQPCGFLRALLRFLPKVIECYGAPLIAVLAFFSTERRQRLGDLLAGTLVVRVEDLK